MGTPGHLLSCLEKPQGFCRGCPGLVGVLPLPSKVHQLPLLLPGSVGVMLSPSLLA